MLSRGLQITLSVLIYFCLTLAGMEKTPTPEEVRADFFVAEDLGEKIDNNNKFTWDDAAIMPSSATAAQSETPVKNFKHQKRNHKRTNSIKLNHSKCRILLSLPEKSESRGVARNPQSQDARQERTAAIRFLHLKSLPVA